MAALFDAYATQQKWIRREMLRRDPALGRVALVTALAAQTATCSSLAFGSFTPGRFFGRYLVRADTATAADRERRVSTYASATGVLTHAGAAYSDTTITGTENKASGAVTIDNEVLEILEYEKSLYDNAINTTITRLLRRDRIIIPARTGTSRYPIGRFPWIKHPNDIIEIKSCQSPVLSNNRYLQKWNAYEVDQGHLIPDDFTVTNLAGTTQRRSTQAWKQYPVSCFSDRSGTDVQATQSISLLETGASADDLQGRTVTVVLVCWSDTASKIRAFQDDDGTDAQSSYHTGDSTWQELTIEFTVDAAATKLEFGWENKTDTGTSYVGECYLMLGSLTDAVRRDNYPEATIEREHWSFNQGGGTLELILPPQSLGSQYVIYSKRPYPQLDIFPAMNNDVDTDAIEAPVETVAVGAIARLYEGLAQRETDNERRSHYEALAAFWESRFKPLADRHLGIDKREPGVDFYRPKALALPPRRF